MILQARELLGNYRGLSELVTTSGFSVLTTEGSYIIPEAQPRVLCNFLRLSKLRKHRL